MTRVQIFKAVCFLVVGVGLGLEIYWVWAQSLAWATLGFLIATVGLLCFAGIDHKVKQRAREDKIDVEIAERRLAEGNFVPYDLGNGLPPNNVVQWPHGDDTH